MKTLALALLILGGAFANAQGPMGGGPMQGGYGGAGVDKATMAKLTKVQQAADAGYKKNPKSAAARKAYIDANNRHGLAAMRTDALDRKVKYRIALADFRKVLKVDPKNSIAKENHDLIVSIYKSMKRPIPGG
ncbi:hypothetical protein EON77_20805 [bacterium]|nr:MAG: hypothetical protein EON77_20805 [bacterium]